MSGRYGLEIRAATAADAPGLAELFGSCGHLISSADLAARIEAIRAGPGTVLIALEWGPPSGIAALHWHPTLQTDLPDAHISALLVGVDARRRGIGRLLVKAASQAARVAGCGALILPAPTDAQELRAFCENTGFAQDAMNFIRALRKKGPLRQ